MFSNCSSPAQQLISVNSLHRSACWLCSSFQHRSDWDFYCHHLDTCPKDWFQGRRKQNPVLFLLLCNLVVIIADNYGLQWTLHKGKRWKRHSTYRGQVQIREADASMSSSCHVPQWDMLFTSLMVPCGYISAVSLLIGPWRPTEVRFPTRGYETTQLELRMSKTTYRPNGWREAYRPMTLTLDDKSGCW